MSPPTGHDGLSEDQKLEVITDHLTRAATLEAVVDVRARTDENDIWHHIMLGFAILALAITLNYTIAVIGMRSRFPKQFCWYDKVYTQFKSHGCKPTLVDGSYEYGPYSLSIASSYPPLFSMFQLFGVPKLRPNAAQFLCKCIAMHGNLITPSIWCGNSSDINDQSLMTSFVQNNGHIGLPSGKTCHWCDLLPHAIKLDPQHDSNTFTDMWTRIGGSDTFVKGWTMFSKSCSFGNPLAAFFPHGLADSTSAPQQFWLQLLSIPAMNLFLQTSFSQRRTTSIGILYDGGLVAVAQELSISIKDPDEMFTYLFVGTSSLYQPPPESCSSKAKMEGLQSASNIGGSMAGASMMLAGHGLFGTILPLVATAGAGTGMYFWKKSTSQDECNKKYPIDAAAPAYCCPGFSGSSGGTKCVATNTLAARIQAQCDIGVPSGSSILLSDATCTPAPVAFR